MHHDIHRTGCRLIRRQCKGELRIHNGKARTGKVGIQRTLHTAFFLRNHAGIAHLTARSRNRQHNTDRQTGRRRCFAVKEVPDIVLRIGHGISDRLCRVNDATAADSQQKVDVFSLCKFDSLSHLGKTGIRLYTAERGEGNIRLTERFFYTVQKAGTSGALTAVMDQDPLASILLYFLPHKRFRSLAENHFCRSVVFKIKHNSLLVCLRRSATHGHTPPF